MILTPEEVAEIEKAYWGSDLLSLCASHEALRKRVRELELQAIDMEHEIKLLASELDNRPTK